MPLRIAEWFGHPLRDTSYEAERCRTEELCPFLNSRCVKTLNDGVISGVCAVEASRSGTVCICPNRLYAEEFKLLNFVAACAFERETKVLHPSFLKSQVPTEDFCVAFGKGFGKEIRVPGKKSQTRHFVDWILCLLSPELDLKEFVALEVQSIDTTGTYKPALMALKEGVREAGKSKAGLNWENVNKRILPQLIQKGQVLRREPLCKKGLFFASPNAVYEKIQARLGHDMEEYKNLQPGSLTFVTVDAGRVPLSLDIRSAFSTTVDSLATAFVSPRDLPDPGVYQSAIQSTISSLS